MSRRYWLRSGTVIPAEQKLQPSEKPSCRMAGCVLKEGERRNGVGSEVRMGKGLLMVKMVAELDGYKPQFPLSSLLASLRVDRCRGFQEKQPSCRFTLVFRRSRRRAAELLCLTIIILTICSGYSALPLFRFSRLGEGGGGAASAAACSRGARRDAGAAEGPGAQGEGEGATRLAGGGVYRRKHCRGGGIARCF